MEKKLTEMLLSDNEIDLIRANRVTKIKKLKSDLNDIKYGFNELIDRLKDSDIFIQSIYSVSQIYVKEFVEEINKKAKEVLNGNN